MVCILTWDETLHVLVRGDAAGKRRTADNRMTVTALLSKYCFSLTCAYHRITGHKQI